MAFLRELFPDDCFDFERKYGLQLKCLKPNKNKKADMLLGYVQKGCHDAIRRGYLKSIILSIMRDRDDPKSTLETYTWHICYPARDLINENSQLSIQISASDSHKVTVDGFRDNAGLLLRQLCVHTQSLPVLPSTFVPFMLYLTNHPPHTLLEKKYIKMMLLYYENVTPKEYEPPGFMPSVFELSNLFHGDTAKHVFGTAISLFHSYYLCVFTLITHRVGVSMERLIEGDRTNNKDKEPEPGLNKETIKEKETGKDKIQCLCGCQLNDLDMIQCECCQTWQHTVCAGFYSNRDSRIQAIKYICFSCRFVNNKAAMGELKAVACYRRALSVVFNEGFSDEKKLSSRLGFSRACTKKQITRMLTDEFLVKENNGGSQISVVKTKQTRDKLRVYFDHELVKFPDLGGSMTQPKVIKPVKPTYTNAAANVDSLSLMNKTSVTELTMSVASEMM